MPWVEVAGTDIYYQEDGPRTGRPLVFLHGNTSCGEAWFQQFAVFRDRYRVIAYDSVNHGHSSNSPRDADEPDRVDELEGFLAALGLAAGPKPVLAGNSMGGNTLLRWAVRHPDGAAALVPSGMGVPLEGAAAAPAVPSPLDMETLFLPIGASLTDGFRERQPRMYERYLRIRSTATRIEALRNPRRPSSATLAERAALATGVPAIRSPMLIVCGSLDPLRPNCERLHALLPGSRYHVVEGAPHNVYYEAAAEYNDVVAAFLADVAPGA